MLMLMLKRKRKKEKLEKVKKWEKKEQKKEKKREKNVRVRSGVVVVVVIGPSTALPIVMGTRVLWMSCRDRRV